MSERPTPETDATVEESFHRINFPTSPVPAEFARRLENERDEARQELENYKAQSIHTCHDQCQRPMCVLRRELDAERALADQLAEGLRKMVLYSEALILRIQDRSDINFKTLNECIDLFNEWKEARND